MVTLSLLLSIIGNNSITMVSLCNRLYSALRRLALAVPESNHFCLAALRERVLVCMYARVPGNTSVPPCFVFILTLSPAVLRCFHVSC